MSILLDKPLRAEDVEPGALLDQANAGRVRETLLRDILPQGPGRAPDVLEPITYTVKLLGK